MNLDSWLCFVLYSFHRNGPAKDCLWSWIQHKPVCILLYCLYISINLRNIIVCICFCWFSYFKFCCYTYIYTQRFCIAHPIYELCRNPCNLFTNLSRDTYHSSFVPPISFSEIMLNLHIMWSLLRDGIKHEYYQ